MSESVNSQIQRIKKRACGFRSRERFGEAILFHLGRLELYPASVRFAHSNVLLSFARRRLSRRDVITPRMDKRSGVGRSGQRRG